MLEVFNASISPERVRRSSDFFSQNYQGEQGLRQFYNQENIYLAQTLDESYDKFKVYLNNELEFRRTQKPATGARGASVPLFPIERFDPNLLKITHVTQNVSYNQGVPRYASGYLNRAGRKPMAFMAKISEGKVEWVREVGAKGNVNPPEGDFCEVMFGFDGGCIGLVSAPNANEYNNALVKLDGTGREIYSKPIHVNHKPIYINYNEINQQSLLAFGYKESDSLKVYSSLVICQTDSIGNVVWKTPLDIQGEVVEIIKSKDKYLAFINYQTYNINGKQGKANDWALLIVTLSDIGSVLEVNPVVSNGRYHIDRIFSISTDEISLWGYASEPKNRSGKLRFLVVSSDGKVKIRNFKD